MRSLLTCCSVIIIMAGLPEIRVEKHKDYRTIIVNGVYGGHRPGFFEAIIYTDEIEADEALSTIPPSSEKVKIRRVLQCRLVMDPVQAKSIQQWLTRHIEEYEKKFGKIPLPEKVPEKRLPYT